MNVIVFNILTLMIQKSEPVLSFLFTIHEVIKDSRKGEMQSHMRSPLNKHNYLDNYASIVRSMFENKTFAQYVFNKLHENNVPFRIETVLVKKNINMPLGNVSRLLKRKN